jgi:hypothetical protein
LTGLISFNRPSATELLLYSLIWLYFFVHQMVRLFFLLFLTLSGLRGFCQQYSMALGVYGGMTVPYTLDAGMDKDPRYKSKYTVKAQPAGLMFAMDYENVGFLISPGIFTLGQNYYIVNASGGQDGERSLDLKYALLPFSLKVHLIDLSFFRVSAVATASAAFLYDARDHLTHEYTKLRFPSRTYPLIEQLPGYSIEYDGVISPETSLMPSKKSDYRSLQFFAGLGLCSDWNVTEHWRVTFDFRVNYGLLDSRSDEYLRRIGNYESIYDIPGDRKEMFAHLAIGISRFLDFDKGDRDRERNLKGNKKKFDPRSQVKMKPSRKRTKLK